MGSEAQRSSMLGWKVRIVGDGGFEMDDSVSHIRYHSYGIYYPKLWHGGKHRSNQPHVYISIRRNTIEAVRRLREREWMEWLSIVR